MNYCRQEAFNRVLDVQEEIDALEEQETEVEEVNMYFVNMIRRSCTSNNRNEN